MCQYTKNVGHECCLRDRRFQSLGHLDAFRVSVAQETHGEKGVSLNFSVKRLRSIGGLLPKKLRSLKRHSLTAPQMPMQELIEEKKLLALDFFLSFFLFFCFFFFCFRKAVS